jgi:hypothetical protein
VEAWTSSSNVWPCLSWLVRMADSCQTVCVPFASPRLFDGSAFAYELINYPGAANEFSARRSSTLLVRRRAECFTSPLTIFDHGHVLACIHSHAQAPSQSAELHTRCRGTETHTSHPRHARSRPSWLTRSPASNPARLPRPPRRFQYTQRYYLSASTPRRRPSTL